MDLFIELLGLPVLLGGETVGIEIADGEKLLPHNFLWHDKFNHGIDFFKFWRTALKQGTACAKIAMHFGVTQQLVAKIRAIPDVNEQKIIFTFLFARFRDFFDPITVAKLRAATKLSVSSLNDVSAEARATMTREHFPEAYDVTAATVFKAFAALTKIVQVLE